MIRRLLCLLGFHKWREKYNYFCYAQADIFLSGCVGKSCSKCKYQKIYDKECIYCRKVKK